MALETNLWCFVQAPDLLGFRIFARWLVNLLRVCGSL